MPASNFIAVPVPLFDKLVHFLFYLVFILSLLWSASLNNLTLKRIVLFAILVIAYGFIIEIIQGQFCTTRFFEWWDVFSNTIATILGGSSVWIFQQRFSKNYINR
jgi:VanZ family protein